jgi:uncharacterized protein (TIGR03437 family)
LTVSPPSGTGNATLTIAATAAPAATEGRVGTVTIGSATLTVNQPPAPCNTQFTPTQFPTVPAGGGLGAITVNTSCATWTPSATANWIRVATAGNTINFTVDANPTGQQRTAEIRAGQAVATVTQAGATCTYTLTPERLEIPAEGGTGLVRVQGGAGCTWTRPEPAVGWLTIEAVVEGQSFSYRALPNPTAEARVTTLAVANQTLNVRQAAQSNAPRVTAAGVVNAASYAGGGVAPGEIVVIFGQNLGPAALGTLELTGDGLAVSTRLQETRVLFDGIPAPMIYTAAGQLSAVVPYGIAGRGTVSMQTEYRGVRSNAVALNVLEAKPGLFTRDASGRGAGAILNQDGSVIGLDRPATPGSVIVLFGTGDGLPDPVPGDGAVIASAPLPKPLLPVSVTIDGQPAEVLYAGAAPSLVAGVFQLNVRIPSGVVGVVPVRVTVGGASANEVTVAVR